MARIHEDYELDDLLYGGSSAPLEGGVLHISVSVDKFYDRGWLNCKKARLFLVLVDEKRDEVCRRDLFGLCRRPRDACLNVPHATHAKRELELDPDPNNPECIGGRATNGFMYELRYVVGGGGGHTTHVENFKCQITTYLPENVPEGGAAPMSGTTPT